MNPTDSVSGPADFDFLVGDWTVHHRRLKKRLADNHDWEEFKGTSSLRKVMNGFGNVDDNVIELPAGTYRAATLRAWDPKTKLWQIWWLDGRMPADIGVPMRGSFEGGVGTFFADEEFEGRPIRVRFLWSDITPTSCRWQQAFSTDQGKTWETNWVMDFERRQ